MKYEEQIKPMGIRLVVRIDKAALAKLHNVKPEEVEVVIEESSEHVVPLEPTERRENARGRYVGLGKKEDKTPTWLQYFLKEKGFSRREAAQLCGVTISTINRACVGTRLRDQNFKAIVRGLELTPEEKRAFKASLVYAQRNKGGKERVSESHEE